METKKTKKQKILEAYKKPVIEVIKIDNNIISTSTEPIADCLAKGTKITMADGSLKNIEDIVLNDKVLTFNHEKGCYEASEIMYVYVCDAPKCSFTLTFADGTELLIVGEHDLFNKESLKYVTLTEVNSEEYVGKHFYSVTKKAYIKLKSVMANKEPVEFYEIYTKNNLNCIANGMLNVADDVDAFLNIYKFKKDLSINAKKLKNDIKIFGLFEYTNKYDITPEEYINWKMRYINVAIGKKLVTFDYVENQRIDYFNKLNAPKSIKTDAQVKTF